MQIWIISRDGLPSKRGAFGFTRLVYFKENQIRGFEAVTESEGSLVRPLDEKLSHRTAELAKRGPKGLADYVEGVDTVGTFEVGDEAIEELERTHQGIWARNSNARRLRSELFEQIRSLANGPGKPGCVKLRVPWTKQLRAALEHAFGPEVVEEWFWSRKHSDFVFYPKHEQRLERILAEHFEGEYLLITKDNIWNVMDGPCPGAKRLGESEC